MRITSTTSSPVITNERTAAGPAALITTPLPTKRPAPMTPPRAIIVMCRCLRPWRSPLEGGGVLDLISFTERQPFMSTVALAFHPARRRRTAVRDTARPGQLQRADGHRTP